MHSRLRLRHNQVSTFVGQDHWLSFYQNGLVLQDFTVTGLDVSRDMQKEAERKAKSLGVPLQTGDLDIFSDNPPQFESNHGLFVSTRFLNWVHPTDLPRMIEVYASANPQWIICSLRYKSGFSIVEHGRRLWSQYIRRNRNIFIHDLENFIQLIAKYSYCVVHDELVEQSVATRFSYFLLEKKITGVCSEETDGSHS